MIKRLLITGYKAHELGIFDEKHLGIIYIKKALQKRLITLIEEGLEWIIISGQLGVELWAGEVVLAMKKENPQLKLAVLTPFFEQEANWSEARKAQYEHVLQQADFLDSITKRKYESPSQLKLKNQFLIQKSDGLLVVYDDEKPGSPNYYLTYAKQRMDEGDYEIYYITPEEIEQLYQDDNQQW